MRADNTFEKIEAKVRKVEDEFWAEDIKLDAQELS